MTSKLVDTVATVQQLTVEVTFFLHIWSSQTIFDTAQLSSFTSAATLLNQLIINIRSSLKTGPARPGHVKIALDITAVDIDLFFFLYSTGKIIIYDRFSL